MAVWYNVDLNHLALGTCFLILEPIFDGIIEISRTDPDSFHFQNGGRVRDFR